MKERTETDVEHPSTLFLFFHPLKATCIYLGIFSIYPRPLTLALKEPFPQNQRRTEADEIPRSARRRSEKISENKERTEQVTMYSPRSNHSCFLSQKSKVSFL
jgi:hypothetical protein